MPQTTRHTTNPWLVLVLVCFAQFMVILDATIVNIANIPEAATTRSSSAASCCSAAARATCSAASGCS